VHRIPSPSRRLLGVLVAAPLIVAACTTTASESTAPAPDETTAVATGEVGGEPEVTPEGTNVDPEEPTAETAAYLDIELTDAATGETFTLASLAGNVVAIEPMAIWCSNCKAQQNNVKDAYADIADAGVTYISLGIDPGENKGALAKYAERNGFEWTFVKSPTELSRELSDLFGQQILSAPSTPLIVLDADGEVFTQEWGFHDPDRLLEILGEAAGASGAA
jgi:cytochrome oxidase Cu insertion factor (SCO1/SenC/PrrC family)